ncbi:TonB-dependent receptor [Mesorhizobium sp. Pch-S]|uniref:TonB-dependent receptor n=1 Tax=Mesorhizobium sp. Pch-S TaxID=2082387 RepID=UPI001FDED212|nr:TonB-dependent receptor [Mesorhizobium sp. Pch-S]
MRITMRPPANSIRPGSFKAEPPASFLMAAVLLSSTALHGTGAWAQTTSKPVTDTGGTVLERIVVTARRASEDAQSVPISINILEGDRVKEISSTSSNSDIARSTPNFYNGYAGTRYTNRAVMRGVGSLLPMSPDDTSVVFNTGDVPTSAFGPMPSTLDLERIEVLRGPQGTLYGRGAQAGAVNFVPVQPGFAKELQLRGEIGSNGKALGEFIANTPLIDDRLAGRLAVQYSQQDGDIFNPIRNGEDGGFRIGAARGSLLFTPDTDTTALLSFNYNSNDGTTQNVLRNASCFPCSGSNPAEHHFVDNYGANLRIERAFESFRLTSISSIQRYGSESRMDLIDGLLWPGFPAGMINDPHADMFYSDSRETDYFQELRLSSPEGSATKWTAGFNFFRSEFGVGTYGENVTFPGFELFSGRQSQSHSTNSYAAFGEATVPLAGGLSGIAGLRLTHEDKKSAYRFQGDGAPGTVDRHEQRSDFSDTYLTGRAGLSYDWSDDFMTYATIGRGAVTGGYPTATILIMFGRDEPMFPTSLSWTYEAGFKSTLWDGQATLNGSVFYNDVSNGHLLSYDATTMAYSIAALDYTSYGGELEARVQLTPELTLFGGLGFTRATLRDVPANNGTGAMSGNGVPNVPEFTANIGAEYREAAERFGLEGGEVYASASYQYVGARAADIKNSFDLAPYGILNGRIGWEGDKTGIYAFGHNLLDKRYEVTGGMSGREQVIRPGLGRTIGVGATVRF